MASEMAQSSGTAERRVEDLIFVGFNSRVAALDRYSGELVWQWKSPKGSGFVSLLLDGDRLIASVNGYTYCLEPLFGQQVWVNPLRGFGLGVPSLASVRGMTGASGMGASAAQQQRAAAAAAAG
jgi:outer membrane protein assembly factor BamB